MQSEWTRGRLFEQDGARASVREPAHNKTWESPFQAFFCGVLGCNNLSFLMVMSCGYKQLFVAWIPWKDHVDDDDIVSLKSKIRVTAVCLHVHCQQPTPTCDVFKLVLCQGSWWDLTRSRGLTHDVIGKASYWKYAVNHNTRWIFQSTVSESE